MSAHPLPSTKPPALQPVPHIRSLRIEWGISRRSLGTRAPAGSDPLVTLRFQTGPGATPSWVLIDPKSGNQIELALPQDPSCPQSQVRLAGNCVHVLAPALYAFVSIERADTPELLYARTDVFKRMNIPGGRYRPLGARVELA